MKVAQVDRTRLEPLLEAVGPAIEELLLGGLTTASAATLKILTSGFQEAARARLFRLGLCLRAAAEELGRFQDDEAGFSPHRLQVGLTRAWLISRALLAALRDQDEAAFARLVWAGADAVCPRVEVVALGVVPRVVPGSYAAFEFRLRVVGEVPAGLSAGQSMAWSFVVPLRAGSTVPAEVHLTVPQKQGFTPAMLLERGTVVFENARLGVDPAGTARLALAEDTRARRGGAFPGLARVAGLEVTAARARLERYRPSPLDLDAELSEEVVLPAWRLAGEGPVEDGRPSRALEAGAAGFHVPLPRGASGATLAAGLARAEASQPRPALFGVMHYERCRLVLLPVSTLAAEGPSPLLIDEANLDPKMLLKELKLDRKGWR